MYIQGTMSNELGEDTRRIQIFQVQCCHEAKKIIFLFLTYKKAF